MINFINLFNFKNRNSNQDIKNNSFNRVAVSLNEEYIRNCKLVTDRVRLLDFFPKNSICAEIGILHGEFSKEILNKIVPKKFHLIDINQDFIEYCKSIFSENIKNNQIYTHLGDSSKVIQEFPDNYFDWVFIDGDHSYEMVHKDLESVRTKIKPEGVIALHDYVIYSHVEKIFYGVIPAVNEFCIKYDYEIIYLALEYHMYNTIVLRKKKN